MRDALTARSAQSKSQDATTAHEECIPDSCRLHLDSGAPFYSFSFQLLARRNDAIAISDKIDKIVIR
jgi:hypothetical protein